METVFEAVNRIFAFITPISNRLWEFPTNYRLRSIIPVVRNFSLSVILLVGTGIFLTIKTRFILPSQPVLQGWSLITGTSLKDY